MSRLRLFGFARKRLGVSRGTIPSKAGVGSSICLPQTHRRYVSSIKTSRSTERLQSDAYRHPLVAAKPIHLLSSLIESDGNIREDCGWIVKA
jgi:hypothetical protein